MKFLVAISLGCDSPGSADVRSVEQSQADAKKVAVEGVSGDGLLIASRYWKAAGTSDFLISKQVGAVHLRLSPPPSGHNGGDVFEGREFELEPELELRRQSDERYRFVDIEIASAANRVDIGPRA
ncbi:hypothetical protein Poly24_20840 [Rosistilla carotiformis]|uniref:Uncharacterized protein n=1 Tax=Rosistilla carotiformis TaxID=2528017 RepID=A0A518JS75_9BACT|nr:hypothetical protein Poly24_20840 [Rosistilla carotiformis]